MEQLMIKSTTSCVKRGGGSGTSEACMAATGTLVFIVYITDDKKYLDEF